MSGSAEGCGPFEVLPAALTVEEAARVLRIGRTKAYALTREWRATGGRSGLPVVDLGDALRVPVAQLEALLGAPLVMQPRTLESDAAPPAAVVEPPSTPTAPDASTPRRPRRRNRPDDQPTLPFTS